jgi:hypothetical protein
VDVRGRQNYAFGHDYLEPIEAMKH